MTVKPPRPFFWFPYLVALFFIGLLALWPLFFFFQQGMGFNDGMYAIALLTPLWVPTFVLAFVLFLVWLVMVLIHRRADREWLATHDA